MMIIEGAKNGQNDKSIKSRQSEDKPARLRSKVREEKNRGAEKMGKAKKSK